MRRKLFSRLFSRNSRQTEPTRASMMEPLEDRQLMSLMNVASAFFDNRGQSTITLSTNAMSSTITKDNIRVYTVGADKKLGTKDDVRVPATVAYFDSLKRIVVQANLPANTKYKVRIYGNRVKAADGTFIDGEFSGHFHSGNGVAGGNFEAFIKTDPSDTPIVRMDTNLGTISIKLYKKLKPKSVANFLKYVNKGDYDNMFITRSLNGFVVQLGSLRINASNVISEPIPLAPVVNEFTTNGVIHNTRGTLSFAKQSGNPDSATNQFFFNLGDNSGNLDGQNGGFTVFAKIKDSSSQTVVDNIAALETVAFFNPSTDPTNQTGVAGPFTSTGVFDVPVLDKTVYNGNGGDELFNDGSGVRSQFVVHGNFHPQQQLVVFKRTALLMKAYKAV